MLKWVDYVELLETDEALTREESCCWVTICVAAGFAPCRTSGKSRYQLSEDFYDVARSNFWPTNSQNCNLTDYYVWCAVEQDTNIRAELVAKIREAFEGPTKATINNRFWSCLEVVGCGYFEYILIYQL